MKKPLIAVVGETASGKSALALRIARRFDGELICADSWTVYKGFDVGTAKPSRDEQRLVRHHLLDVADPATGFSAVEFKRLALAAIEDITARGKLPVMVGGTGLYIDAVLYDYQFLPAPDPARREELNGLSLLELQHIATNKGLDLSTIDKHNKRRVIRLIENDGSVPGRGPLRPDTLIVGISVDREALRQRVTARVDSMLAAGLEQEVSRLAGLYGWEVEPMKGIGYREWRPYFEPQPELHQDLAQTRDRIIAATMGLAKRQRTWFKRNERIQWLSGPGTEDDYDDIITTFVRG